MAKLVVEIDTDAVLEVRVTVDGELVPELPHQFTLHISSGVVSGAAHFWKPENRWRYSKYGESFATGAAPVEQSDLELLAIQNERQGVVSKLLKKLPFIKQWLFEMQPMPERPPERV